MPATSKDPPTQRPIELGGHWRPLRAQWAVLWVIRQFHPPDFWLQGMVARHLRQAPHCMRSPTSRRVRIGIDSAELPVALVRI